MKSWLAGCLLLVLLFFGALAILPVQKVYAAGRDIVVPLSGSNRLARVPVGGGTSDNLQIFPSGNPAGAAVDSQGNYIVTLSTSNKLVKVDVSGQTRSDLAAFPSGSNPQGVVVDATGNYIVALSGADKLVRVPSGGGSASDYVVFPAGSQPTGVAKTTSAEIIVALSGTNRIVRVPAGGGGFSGVITYGEGIEPTGVTLDASGAIIATLTGLNKIVRVTLAGISTDIFTFSSNQHPTGIVVDSVGNFVVALSAANKIERIPFAGGNLIDLFIFPDGSSPALMSLGILSATTGDFAVPLQATGILTSVPQEGGATSDLFNFGGQSPTGVDIDAAGNFVVTLAGTNKLVRIPVRGGASTDIFTFPAGSAPQGVAVDSSGNYLVALRDQNKLTKILVGGGSMDLASFVGGSLPTGVTVQSNGDIVVTLRGTSQLVRVKADGSLVTTLFTFASGSLPSDVAIDGTGNFIIALSGTNKLVRVDSQGRSSVDLFTFPAGSQPFGVAVDVQGNFVVTTLGTGKVIRVSSSGFTTVDLATLPSGSQPGLLATIRSPTPLLPDFTVSVSPTSFTLNPGDAEIDTVTVRSFSGFNSPVSLTTSWVGVTPSDATINLASSVTPPSGGAVTTTLTLQTSSTTNTGSFTLRVSGTSGEFTWSADIAVKINALPPSADFSLTVNPSEISVNQGSTRVTTVTIRSLSGFNQPVLMSFSWVGMTPNNVVVNIPSPVTPPSDGSLDFTVSVAATIDAQIGSFLLRILGQTPSLRHSIDVGVTVSSPSGTPDFSISVSPNTILITQGGSDRVTAAVTSLGQFDSAVTLSTLGAPAGVTLSFDSSPITPSAGGSASTTLRISVDTSVAAQEYTIIVSGEGAGIKRSTDLLLNVLSNFDFRLSSSPSSQTVALGRSTSYSITVSLISGDPQTVTLTVTGVPDGATASIDPSFGQPPFIATFKISAGSFMKTGTFTLTITGTAGPLTRSTSTTLTVSQCLIATAAYGSELSDEVQILRSFRNEKTLPTFAGSRFMMVFDEWYYSFSPWVARTIANHDSLRSSMKLLLYPLIEVLKASTYLYFRLDHAPEFAIIASGIMASMLLSAIYLGPLSFILGTRFSRYQRRAMKPLCIAWVTSLSILSLGEFFTLNTPVLIGAPGLVLLTMILTATAFSMLGGRLREKTRKRRSLVSQSGRL